MAKRKTDPDDLRAAQTVAAARLCADGVDQKNIAKRLDISQPGVSRLLNTAEKHGWLIRTPKVLKGRIRESTWQEAELLLYPQDLKSRFRKRFKNSRLRSLRVRDSGPDDETDLDRRIARFANLFAPRFAQLLAEARVVGVTWGRTIQGIITALEALWDDSRDKRRRSFVPLCGDPLGDVNVSFSSSQLSTRLYQFINGGRGSFYTLSGVPVFAPIDFNDAEVAAVDKLLRSMSSFADIFLPVGEGESKKCLVGDIDLMLTSLGPTHRALGYSKFGMLYKRAGLTQQEIQKLVVGDVGGVLLPRPNLTAPQKRRLAKINRHWHGLKLSHLEAISAAADEKGHPGIVVAAFGAGKADVVTEVVRRGLVQELWIDRALAEALLEILGPPGDDDE